MNVITRTAEEKDSEKVWYLMKSLAVFENTLTVLLLHR